MSTYDPTPVSTIHPDTYRDLYKGQFDSLLETTMKHYQADMERSIFTRTAVFPKPTRKVTVRGGPLHGKTYEVGPSTAIRIPTPFSMSAIVVEGVSPTYAEHMCWVELPLSEGTEGLNAMWRDRKVCCSKADEAFGESRTGPTKR